MRSQAIELERWKKRAETLRAALQRVSDADSLDAVVLSNIAEEALGLEREKDAIDLAVVSS